MKVQSTKRKEKRKPKRFALSIHKASGYWCRKVYGRVYYFGKVEKDPNGVAALERWEQEKDALFAGRDPRQSEATDGMSVRELANEFLTHHRGRVDIGELNPRTFLTYHNTCKTICDVLGKERLVTDLGPNDFCKLRNHLAGVPKKKLGAVALRNEIIRVRSVFKYAFTNGLINKPVVYGSLFALPSQKTIRLQKANKRHKHGKRMLEAEPIRQILAAAGQPLKTMTLLAMNCGFGQSDLSKLPITCLDLKNGWVDYPRPKTGIDRRIPLWPETVAALKEWKSVRPKAKHKDDRGLVFLTRCGTQWVKFSARINDDKPGGAPSDAIGHEFNKLLRKLKLKRKGVSFYALRHTFETIGGASRDQVAVNAIMGHVDSTMAAAYREGIDDERLRAVTEHVRRWLELVK